MLQVSTKVTVHEVMPSTKAVLSFDVPDHKSGKVSDSVLVSYNICLQNTNTIHLYVLSSMFNTSILELQLIPV